MFRRLGTFILDILQIIVFAVALFLFAYLLVVQPHKIKGQSMDPTFKDGEYLLTDKVTYRLEAPQRGDVVVFKAPPDDKDEYIKRIIGLPGDHVMVANGRFYVNGQPLEEKYLPAGLYTQAGTFALESKDLVVPANSYFVSGDNRNHSYDSRHFGFIGFKKITGKAWFVYWPPQKAGIVQAVSY